MTDSTTLEYSDLEAERRAANVVHNCAKSRIYFCESVLGLELENWQYDELQALDEGCTRISIRSGNGVGKTFFCSIVSLHFLLFRTECKIVVTSPSASQLNDGLYPEVIKWRDGLPDFLKKHVSPITNRITRVDNADNAFISFRTARRETPEALAGIHSKYVLCIVDEASGVAEEVYEAAQGTLSTSGAIFILIGNPTRLSGYFYRTHHDLRPYWRTRRLSSFDTSRVDQSFVDTIANTYGEDSDQYRVKVLGEFPKREADSLIARDIVEAAVGRDIESSPAPVMFGLDVGRGGDSSALVGRKGNDVFFAAEFNDRDAMATVGWAKEHIDNLKKTHPAAALYVDSIGMGGPVADRLRELGVPAFDINVGEAAALKSVYLRLRDEIWYAVKFYFEGLSCKITIEDPVIASKLVEEVSSPLALFTSTGKNAVERKTDMKSRGVPSPNLADALALTFAQEGAMLYGIQRGGGASNWDKPLNVDTSYIV